METTDIKSTVTFESLVTEVKALALKEKIELLELIQEQIEEALSTQNSQIEEEINAARKAYEIGDYVTLEEYKARNWAKLQ